MLTIIDLDTVMLDGAARVEGWEREWQAQWDAPLIVARQIQQLLSATPEEQEALRENDPELFDRLNQRINALKRRMQREDEVNYG